MAIKIAVLKAPDDPDEKKAWAHQMMRVQVAMWLPASCFQCGKQYVSVDDFLERNPKAGYGWPDGQDRYIDSACWKAYAKTHKRPSPKPGVGK